MIFALVTTYLVIQFLVPLHPFFFVPWEPMGVYAAPLLLANDVTEAIDPGIFLRHGPNHRRNQSCCSAGLSHTAANGPDLLAAGHDPPMRAIFGENYAADGLQTAYRRGETLRFRERPAARTFRQSNHRSRCRIEESIAATLGITDSRTVTTAR